jgi:hypothetical protein
MYVCSKSLLTKLNDQGDKMRKISLTLMSFVAALLSLSSLSAFATPVNTIYLRKNCTEGGVTVSGCYTTLANLNTAITTINPNATKQLLIDVGPGTFSGTFRCANVSNVTLRGSGRTNTVLGSLGAMNNFQLTNCNNLNVSSLKILGTYYLIQWTGTGVTTWTDVEVSGAGIGWYDDTAVACTPAATKHYWYSSKFDVHPFLTQSATYVANCGSHWFYGSELVSTSETLAGIAYPSAGTNEVIRAASGSEVHVYGSVMRILAPLNTTGSINRFNIVSATGGAMVHIHGTGIDAESAFALNVVALTAGSGGEIHANESSYNLKTAGGTITRVLKADTTAHIHAPYFWETHAEVPAIVSVNGYDTAMVTNTTDGYPHMVVYSTACASSWYDMTVRVCR